MSAWKFSDAVLGVTLSLSVLSERIEGREVGER